MRGTHGETDGPERPVAFPVGELGALAHSGVATELLDELARVPPDEVTTPPGWTSPCAYWSATDRSRIRATAYWIEDRWVWCIGVWWEPGWERPHLNQSAGWGLAYVGSCIPVGRMEASIRRMVEEHHAAQQTSLF